MLLSRDERCDDGGIVLFAELFPNDSSRQVDGRVYTSPQCDDGVAPIIDLQASLHSDGSARINGDIKMFSSFCVFNNTLDPCSNGNVNGIFVIRHVDLELLPGGRVDLPCSADRANRVDFRKLELQYAQR